MKLSNRVRSGMRIFYKSDSTAILKTMFLTVFILYMMIACFGFQKTALGTDNMQPVYLTCESLINPLGVDQLKPRLSWKLESVERGQKQTAYRILVADSQDNLDKNIGDLWDSGKVESDQSIYVTYQGKPFQSRMQCFWKVMAWDKGGKASAWSKPSLWTMGLLKPQDWKAKWIVSPGAVSSPWYRKTFTVLKKPERAFVTLAALGYFEIYINGRKVGDRVLEPAVSNYAKRSYYQTYDLTPYLVKGENCIGIWMGRGWYSPGLPGVKHQSPAVRAELCLQNGPESIFIVTDQTWLTHTSSRKLLGTWRHSNFGGELIDARQQLKSWCKVKIESKNLPVNLPPISQDMKPFWIWKGEESNLRFRRVINFKTLPDQVQLFMSCDNHAVLKINGKEILKTTDWQNPDIIDLGKHIKCGDNLFEIQAGNEGDAAGLLLSIAIKEKNDVRFIISDKSWQVSDNLPDNPKWLQATELGRYGVAPWDERILGIDSQAWDIKNWVNVMEFDGTGVPLVSQTCPGNHQLAPIAPISVENLNKDTILVDFGTNLTGLMKMTFRNLKPNQKVTMYYADTDARGKDYRNDAKIKHEFSIFGQLDQFISAGSLEEKFSNMFNYHGFRYVLIEGLSYLPDKADLAAVPVETAVTEVGSFSCSNELYNQIHKMVRWTYRCLNLGGQTVDCPHREKLGYGDGQTIMDTGCFNFDAASLYAKWSRNWWDEQRGDGSMPFTAPNPYATGGGPAWGAMCIVVPWKTYLFYNDQKLLADSYPYMKRYIDYLDTNTVNGLLRDVSDNKWGNLGDWVPPGRGMEKEAWVDDTSRQLFNNCYRLYMLQILEKIATVLDKKNDAKAFEQEIRISQKAIHKTYFNPKQSTYANGEQPYMIFPLKTGVTPDELKKAVFDKYVNILIETDRGHLNSGMIGTQMVTDYLLEINRNDLVDTFVNKRTYPGWGYMIEKGATTCWEQWNGYFSRIHSCFPYIGGWFYRGLAGIRWDPDVPGFKHVILRPGLVKSVDWVKCSYNSHYGKIVSNWKLDDYSFTWNVTVPVNSTATIYVPAKATADVTEGGLPLTKVEGIKFLRMENGRAVLKLESGAYNFTAQGVPAAKAVEHSKRK